jgi:hypothetical protein
MSVVCVFLAEILGYLSLLPFNLTPRFKVKCDIGSTLNHTPTMKLGQEKRGTGSNRHVHAMYWIDGEWVDSNRHRESIDPTTYRVIGSYADGGTVVAACYHQLKTTFGFSLCESDPSLWSMVPLSRSADHLLPIGHSELYDLREGLSRSPIP